VWLLQIEPELTPSVVQNDAGFVTPSPCLVGLDGAFLVPGSEQEGDDPKRRLLRRSA
jgi:hypothetical protein